MKRRTAWTVAVILAGLLSLGCSAPQPAAEESSEFMLPVGNAEDGREAFLEMRCHTCHVVAGDPEMPDPVSASKGPEIGPMQADRSREWIAESIISPSHELPPLQEGLVSPMGSYRKAMTVQQFIDIVAYVTARSQ